MQNSECPPLWPLLAKMVGLFVICSFVPLQAQDNSAMPADTDVIAYPSIDADLGEALHTNEEKMAQEIGRVIEKSIRKTYSPGNARRDAHPKAHGCVKAELEIFESIPEHLAHGIFVPGKTYQTWIRFSNGSKDPTQPDIKKDARGMAIKVLGVQGDKLLEDEAEASTQDFILVNHPVFFANDPERYLSLVTKLNSDSFFQKLLVPFALGFKGSQIVLKTVNTKIANPLQARYWSMVPYQLGDGPNRQAVKYSARPCSPGNDSIPDSPSPDYLRDAMRTTLANGDACFEFLVQPRTADTMSVEDSMTEWTEAHAPFYAVATLRIPRQIFDTNTQHQFCENLSFSPWHALPEHKPLGVTNRLRKVIYHQISRVRHEMNATHRQEPNSVDVD
jgi:Catalase